MSFLLQVASSTNDFDVNADRPKKEHKNATSYNKPFLFKNSMFLYSFIFPSKILQKTFLYKLLIINMFEFLLQKTFKKTSQNIWSVLKKPVSLHSQIRNNAYHTNKNSDAKALRMRSKTRSLTRIT